MRRDFSPIKILFPRIFIDINFRSGPRHAFKLFKKYIPVRNLLSADNGQTFPLEDEHFEVCGLIMIDLT